MAGLRKLDGSFWQGFRTETDGKERYFYGNDTLYNKVTVPMPQANEGYQFT